MQCSSVRMLSLCQPYGPTITCLCDEAASVLRCFLTAEEGDRVNNVQEDHMVPVTNTRWHSEGMPGQSRAQCSQMVDMKTEVIIAVAIVLVIVAIIAM